MMCRSFCTYNDSYVVFQYHIKIENVVTNSIII